MQSRTTTDPKDFILKLRVSQEYLDGIDAYRKKQRPILSRSAAIRTLTAIALGKIKPK